MSTCCDMTRLYEFVAKAKPKEQFTYYIGYNLDETVMSKQLAKMTYEYSVQGKVYLFRRKNNPECHCGVFDYFMMKASSNPAISLIPYDNEKRREKEERKHRYVEQRKQVKKVVWNVGKNGHVTVERVQ